jgi:hypothetical protein
VSGVLDAGGRALNAAAGYVGELAPRHPVEPGMLERLVLEQLAWTKCGETAYEQAIEAVHADRLRMQLVHAKLRNVREQEVLSQLVRDIGARPPGEMPTTRPVSVGGDGHASPEPRHSLASALSIAVQSAEGWRAMAAVAGRAHPDHIAQALWRACEAVGNEPREQVEVLAGAILEQTTAAVLGP